jgi:hypothetical protein
MTDAKGWQLDRIKTPTPALYNHDKSRNRSQLTNLRQAGNQ